MGFPARMDTVPARGGAAYLTEMRKLLTATDVQADTFTGAVLSSVVPALEAPLLNRAPS